MAIEALYPSRRHPQRNNPLFRRERRRRRLIVILALGFCIIAMGVFRISPDEAAAAARPPAVHRLALAASKLARRIRVIPLYVIPPEQMGAIFSYQN